jgi:hypothetical protein
MATLILDVPAVAQSKSNTCWHASASMLWLYSQQQTGRQGPMNTLADHWKDNQAVGPGDFIGLASKVGLREVPRSETYTSDGLQALLSGHGPLWCAGYWYGPGHVIVLTGIDGSEVRINDPDGGVKKTELLAWFNTKLANSLAGCLMSKDPARY